MKKLIASINLMLMTLLLISVGLMVFLPQYPIPTFIGIVGGILILAFVGFVGLRPKLLPPPDNVDSLDEVEEYLKTLVNHNAASPPEVSLVVVKESTIVYQFAVGMADGRNIKPTNS